MATEIKKIISRRDTAAKWEANNPILAQGEIGVDTTNKVMKIGDGVTPWKSLTGVGGVEIVNDLTTGGADKALSAEMGKELGKENEYTRFISMTSEGDKEENYEWEQLVSFKTLRGYYKTDGTFVESSAYSAKISVEYGQLYRIKFNYSKYSPDISMISLFKGEEFRGYIMSSTLYQSFSGTFIFKIPVDVDSVVVMQSLSLEIAKNNKILKIEENTRNINSLVDIVNKLEVQVPLLAQGEGYPDFGIDNKGKIIKYAWGLTVIPVLPNTTYYIRCKVYDSVSVGALGYGENNAIAAGNTFGYVNMSTLASSGGYKVYTTTETTNYLLINRTPLNVDNEVEIKLNTEDVEYATTGGEREINKEIGYLKKYHSFEGKKMAIFGDSITWQSISSTPNRGWVTYFSELLKFGELVNYARSGATWSNTDGTAYNITENTGSLSKDNVIYNQFNRLLNDISNGAKAPDYIIIAAGTNDAWYPSERPNALNKTAKEVFEDETTNYLDSVGINQCTSIAQAFRYVAEMIMENFPNAQVVICTPLQSTAFTAERNDSITEVITSCANYMSWNVITQSKECGISRLEEKRGYKNTYDGTHTSEIGAKMIGAHLANRFVSLYSLK